MLQDNVQCLQLNFTSLSAQINYLNSTKRQGSAILNLAVFYSPSAPERNQTTDQTVLLTPATGDGSFWQHSYQPTSFPFMGMVNGMANKTTSATKITAMLMPTRSLAAPYNQGENAPEAIVAV